MPAASDSPATRLRWLSLPLLLGLVAVAAARLCTLPHSLWEGDEVLFVKGIERFDPLHHQPHPPGYPLLIGLGKLLNLLLHDPFVSLVTLSVISSLLGYLALVDAFRRIGGSERVAVAGAALFHLSPAMLLYGPLPLSDPPALMFLSLALAAAARLRESASVLPALALGAAASAAVGCRPQLTVAVLPMLVVALWAGGRGMRRLRGGRLVAGLGAFTAVSILWFVPLVVAVGGPAGFLPFLGRQAGLVAQYDAGAPRAGGWTLAVMTRFIAHPWGTRWTAIPVLALAAGGVVSLVAARRTGALPLAVLCTVDLAFGLLVMNPFDAVRYALPSLLGVAFAAAAGCDALARRARMPFAAWPAAALLATGFILYTEPLLAVRTTTDSPPVQAARWIERSVPKSAVLIVEAELAPHASYLLREYRRIPADPGLQRTRESTPQTGLYCRRRREHLARYNEIPLAGKRRLWQTEPRTSSNRLFESDFTQSVVRAGAWRLRLRAEHPPAALAVVGAGCSDSTGCSWRPGVPGARPAQTCARAGGDRDGRRGRCCGPGRHCCARGTPDCRRAGARGSGVCRGVIHIAGVVRAG